jgi:hypothetical protein
MAVTAIICFNTSAPVDSTITNLVQALKTLDDTTKFVIGIKVQDSTAIQITSEWSCFHSAAATSSSLAFRSFTEIACRFASSPPSIILASLDQSPFAHSTPPIMEYVKSDFPAETVTPEFQKSIEDDFERFERLYRNRGTQDETGEIGLATGWAEEQDGVKSFLVLRGWIGMRSFEEAVGSDAFKECIPILMGWKVPFNLVSFRLEPWSATF